MSEMIPTPEMQVQFTQWLENLRVDVSETVAGVALRGARPVPILATYGGNQRPLNSAGSLVGWSLRNRDTANSVTVLLYDTREKPESGVADAAVFPITLGPGESVRDWFGPGGIHLSNGLYVDAQLDNGTPTTASVTGHVFLRGVE